MTSDRIEDFERSARAHETSTVRTVADEFEQALSAAIVPPAVGASFPLEGISVSMDITTEPSPEQIREAQTGVTPAGLGIAEYGTIAIQSRTTGDEPISLYPERHVAVLCASDIVPRMSDAVEWLETEIDAGHDSVVFATGPSATGDMGALVRGVHGPKEVHIIVVTDR